MESRKYIEGWQFPCALEQKANDNTIKTLYYRDIPIHTLL